MKFCDKLVKIRKENNITQEQLADKLNVSRQAVSKWESGTAYPDTEKLIQISKIFNVSLDELINDNKQLNEETKKETKKIDVPEAVNIALEFLSKAYNMFLSMKFKEKIKCLFEMIILILVLSLASTIITSTILAIIRKLFIFLPHDIVYTITDVIEVILSIAWLVIGTMITVKIFKTRYLDYYIIINDENIDKRVEEEPIKELKEKKDYKIVIRDPADSNLNILKKIGKLCNFILKIFAIIIIIPVLITFTGLIITLVISLKYLFYGLFFNGITITTIGAILFTILVIEFIYNLVFNIKHQYTRGFILFIISIFLIGGGIGLSIISFGEFKINDSSEIEYIKNDYVIEMKDNLVFEDIGNLSDDKIVIDNKLDSIKLTISTPKETNLHVSEYPRSILKDKEYYSYTMVGITTYIDGLDTYKKIVKDLKNKEINAYNLYDYGYEIDKIYISNNNLTKLKENYHKMTTDIDN